jgi:hypothetical protein
MKAAAMKGIENRKKKTRRGGVGGESGSVEETRREISKAAMKAGPAIINIETGDDGIS